MGGPQTTCGLKALPNTSSSLNLLFFYQLFLLPCSQAPSHGAAVNTSRCAPAKRNPVQKEKQTQADKEWEVLLPRRQEQLTPLFCQMAHRRQGTQESPARNGHPLHLIPALHQLSCTASEDRGQPPGSRSDHPPSFEGEPLLGAQHVYTNTGNRV